MRNFARLSLLLVLVLIFSLFLSPQTVQARDRGDDQIIFGSDFRLLDGETLNGSLIMFGGNATLEDDSTVTGDVIIFGGTLQARGNINGSLTSLGGTIKIYPGAVILGDLNIVSGTVEQNGIVRGRTNEGPGQFFSLDFIDRLHLTAIWVRPSPAEQMLWILVRSLVVAALAAFVALLAPKATTRASDAIATQPFVSGGVGCLSLVVVPAMLILLIITIILIPISILGFIAFGIAMLFGWISLGTAIGNAIERAFKNDLPVPVSAGIGTLVLSVGTDLIIWGASFFWPLFCCVVFPFLLVVISVALGGIAVTGFGSRDFIGASRAAPRPIPQQPFPVPPPPGYKPPAPAEPAAPPPAAPEPPSKLPSTDDNWNNEKLPPTS